MSTFMYQLRLAYLTRHLAKNRYGYQWQSNGPQRPTRQLLATAASQEKTDPTIDHESAPRQQSWSQISRPLKIRRASRFGFKSFSPNALLINKLRDRLLTWDDWVRWRLIACSRSSRLVVMNMQYLLRCEQNTSLSQLLQGPMQWERRMALMALRGLDENDLAHWIWILKAPDADTKIDRFLSSSRPKPDFIVMSILRKDEQILKQRSLVRMYDYVALMCQHSRTGPPRTVPRTLQERPMAPKFFMTLLDRLVHHCMLRFPSSMPTLARLVVDYLQGIPEDYMPRRSRQRTGYANRCLVFNFAIQRFSRLHAKIVSNLRYNWKAQTVLLALSAEMKRPMVITKESYRAIRSVLVGLKKEEMERATAIRHSRTWPPYVRQLDGLDEAKQPEDYLSRSVRAGILQRQDGYPDTTRDRGLDILGGALLDESITIQTRSTPQRDWKGAQSSLQVFTEWAHRVRATRNAHEAWYIFNRPPMPRLKPNFQVYAEMFSKLFAKELNPSSEVLPGDTTEVFPPHIGNWSKFERAKRKPCTREELYARMLREGNRPVGTCLLVLLRNTHTLRRAKMFLDDSPLDRHAVQHLTMPTLTEPRPRLLDRIPLPIFAAYIGCICRRQGDARWRYIKPKFPPTERALRRYENISRAIKLVKIRLGSSRKKAKEAKEAWLTILQALAAEGVVLRPWVTQAEDDMASLHQLLDVFQEYKATQAMDPLAFHCLSRCVRKIAYQAAASQQSEMDAQVMTTAVQEMKSTFWELVSPVQGLSERLHGDLPPLFYDVSSANVSVYVETLGLLGEYDEIARVMAWILTTYGQDGILEKARNPGHKQWGYMQQAFMYFRAFCSDNLAEDVLRKIEKRFTEIQADGGSWQWPSDDEVRDYMDQYWGKGRGDEGGNDDTQKQVEDSEEDVWGDWPIV